MRTFVLPQGASSGYLRLGANAKGKVARFEAQAPAHPPIEVRASPAAPADMSLGPVKAERTEARAMGYTGDQCTTCSSMRMKISGHCLVCSDCGTTTGCS